MELPKEIAEYLHFSQQICQTTSQWVMHKISRTSNAFRLNFASPVKNFFGIAEMIVNEKRNTERLFKLAKIIER
jgi:hypothetical protein